jgi:dihydroorotate dehydrogenase electron transfer subunit
LKSGESLNLILPLGNSFTIPSSNDTRVLLVGGGVGVAPLLYLGSILQKQGFEVNFLLGARSKADLLQLCEFEKYGNVYTTTEDGSHGEKGYVTQHSILEGSNFDLIYTCGPTPMMKAVAAYAANSNVECEVSLENTMACGIGACLCCVTDSTDGHVCVCTEGPVFNITKLKWQI